MNAKKYIFPVLIALSQFTYTQANGSEGWLGPIIITTTKIVVGGTVAVIGGLITKSLYEGLPSKEKRAQSQQLKTYEGLSKRGEQTQILCALASQFKDPEDLRVCNESKVSFRKAMEATNS